MFRTVRPISGLLLALTAFAPAASAKPLAAEDLFRAPLVGQLKLSPDGRHVAAIMANQADLHDLVIVNLQDDSKTGLRGTGRFEPTTCTWIDDDKLVFQVSREKMYAWGVYAASIHDLDRHRPINTWDVAPIIGRPHRRPGHVLLWIAKSTKDQGRQGPVVEINAEPAAHGRGPEFHWNESIVRTYPLPDAAAIAGWMTNREGELTLALTKEGRRTGLHRFDSAHNTWQRLIIDTRQFRPMALDADDRYLWVVTHTSEIGFALCRYHLGTGAVEKPVHTDARYDISKGRLVFSAKTHQLVGLRYNQRRAAIIWFDQTYANMQAGVDKLYPDTDNLLMGQDKAGARFIYLAISDRQPGVCLVVNLADQQIKRFATLKPWLEGKVFQPAQPFSCTTRDGLKLEGYLTLPAGTDKEHLVPMVVIAHGGPWVRDTWRFDSEVQFLASRGYAVLQINYRGSSGYAPEISGAEDFGRMSDDVTDATRAILHTGLIDPQRIAIMGGSFGGYLALAGVTSEPDLYRCAITICGVFDWEAFTKSKRNWRDERPGEYEFLTDLLGTPGEDREKFDQLSPLTHVARIKVPVFIAHGTEDKIVAVKQSRQLVAALKAEGVPYQTFFRSLEGHGFYNYKNRVAFYHAVEKFLAAHLGGKSAPTES